MNWISKKGTTPLEGISSHSCAFRVIGSKVNVFDHGESGDPHTLLFETCLLSHYLSPLPLDSLANKNNSSFRIENVRWGSIQRVFSLKNTRVRRSGSCVAYKFTINMKPGAFCTRKENDFSVGWWHQNLQSMKSRRILHEKNRTISRVVRSTVHLWHVLLLKAKWEPELCFCCTFNFFRAAISFFRCWFAGCLPCFLFR